MGTPPSFHFLHCALPMWSLPIHPMYLLTLSPSGTFFLPLLKPLSSLCNNPLTVRVIMLRYRAGHIHPYFKIPLQPGHLQKLPKWSPCFRSYPAAIPTVIWKHKADRGTSLLKTRHWFIDVLRIKCLNPTNKACRLWLFLGFQNPLTTGSPFCFLCSSQARLFAVP